MHQPAPLRIIQFGAGDPLETVKCAGAQVRYLRGYLADLGATSILEEQNYFDRDYLSEFAAFYGTSASGYPNVCRRLHFFSGSALTRAEIEEAAGSAGPHTLSERYLGFVVLRPIPQACLGRTVLRWYN